jgi:glycosyltransferase involved in cell wall biosynthesis
MQSGVPIVGSAVGGIPDQVRHNVNGLLVPPGDATALARAIERLAADPAQARRLGEAGRRRCAAEFSFAAMAAAVETTYRQAIARRGAAVG